MLLVVVPPLLIPVGFIAELTGKVRLTTVAWAVDVAVIRALRSYASVAKSGGGGRRGTTVRVHLTCAVHTYVLIGWN